MRPFVIPEDFRDFMKSVVVYLDTPHPGQMLDAEDALDSECGYGGRIDGVDTFLFRYLSRDGHQRWDVTLKEAQIRDIADGLLIEVEAEPFEIVRTSRRTPVGEPLLVWGEYPEDALRIRSAEDLLAAFDTLHMMAADRPKLVRVWTAADDQLVMALWGDRCALYVVDSPDGYATSMGDPTLNESFVVTDHEGRPLMVPLADCVSWDYARRALVRFVEHSDLGDVPVEGRIPSQLLMLGDVDRKTALGARPDIGNDLETTSLRRPSVPVPVEPAEETTAPVEPQPVLGPLELSKWAQRLLERLKMRGLIELAPAANLDDLGYQIGGLLQAHAVDAEHSVEAADWLANEIGAMRGVTLFATGTDLQVAVRRSRDV